ncbi:YtxH domain-containing protein [Candidatus Uhrbacteria bacterium]|nr:YtxH domain-containing protein [Candidatus Uhrbacteria bacterium]
MSAKSFLKGATIGAIVASVAALLCAPQAGKKSRREVTKLATMLAKKISVQARSMEKLSKHAYEELVTQSVTDYAKGKTVAKEYYDEVAKILKSNWKEIKEVLRKKE